MPIKDDPLTRLIIGCCFRVANELGQGFAEIINENALAHELRKAKVKVVMQQAPKTTVAIEYGPVDWIRGRGLEGG